MERSDAVDLRDEEKGFAYPAALLLNEVSREEGSRVPIDFSTSSFCVYQLGGNARNSGRRPDAIRRTNRLPLGRQGTIDGWIHGV